MPKKPEKNSDDDDFYAPVELEEISEPKTDPKSPIFGRRTLLKGLLAAAAGTAGLLGGVLFLVTRESCNDKQESCESENQDPKQYLGAWQIQEDHSFINGGEKFTEFTLESRTPSPDEIHGKAIKIDQKDAPLLLPVTIKYNQEQRYAGIFQAESQNVLIIWNTNSYGDGFDNMLGLKRSCDKLIIGFGAPKELKNPKSEFKELAPSDVGRFHLKDVNVSYVYATLKKP